MSSAEDGVDDGTRTHDGRNHNPGLYQLSYVHHCPGAPGRIRTCDPRLRRPMLYPAELRARSRSHNSRRIQMRPRGRVEMVGARGFEPPTLCSQSRCATRLRHAPIDLLPCTGAESYGRPSGGSISPVAPPLYFLRQVVPFGPSSSTIPAPDRRVANSIRFLQVLRAPSKVATFDEPGRCLRPRN